jgi:hypothetical protein
VHVGTQPCDDRHVQFLTKTTLRGKIDVSHVYDYPLGEPGKTLLQVEQTGPQKKSLSTIGWCRPGHQRHEQDGGAMVWQPESQRVFFVTDEPSRLPRFTSPSAQGGLTCTQFPVGLFLYSLVAAGRSVASIKPTPG